MDRIRLYVPQLEFCGCGCSLRAGSLVIGWAVMIIHALVTALMADFAFKVWTGKTVPPVLDDGNTVTTSLEIFGTLFMSSACMITAFILILGIHKSKAKYLVPFIVLLTLTTIFEVLVFSMGFIVVLFDLIRNVPSSVNISEKFLTLFDGFLNAYFVLVINSYYNILGQCSSYVRETV